MQPSVPESVEEGLRAIRSGLHLRWNPKGAVKVPGGYDAEGGVIEPVYEPRWEVWDVDPQGAEYRICTIQTREGEFQPADERVVRHLQIMNPENWGGSVARMIEELVDEPERLRELGTEKDFDDLAEAVSRLAEWVETPKSYAGQRHCGQRLLSGR